jgi:hypothetical protein
MPEEIKITFDMDDIEQKSDSEKLSLLLKIAFSNHTVLNEHGRILFGNGKQGLCDSVRWNKRAIGMLYGGFVTFVLTISGFLFHHLSKG